MPLDPLQVYPNYWLTLLLLSNVSINRLIGWQKLINQPFVCSSIAPKKVDFYSEIELSNLGVGETLQYGTEELSCAYTPHLSCAYRLFF